MIPRANHRRAPRRHGTAAGFSLIEALVALVVLSIGMLGIAALYIEGLRASRTALVRTEAVNLADDMADRIRANRDGGDDYAGPAAIAPNANCMAGGAGCDPADMAAHDLRVWLDQVAASLPGGTGTVEWDDPDPGDESAVYTVTVSWTEAEQGQLNYTLRVET
jgi:type IV pilus assembly protein PilV